MGPIGPTIVTSIFEWGGSEHELAQSVLARRLAPARPARAVHLLPADPLGSLVLMLRLVALRYWKHGSLVRHGHDVASPVRRLCNWGAATMRFVFSLVRVFWLHICMFGDSGTVEAVRDAVMLFDRSPHDV